MNILATSPPTVFAFFAVATVGGYFGWHGGKLLLAVIIKLIDLAIGATTKPKRPF